MTRDSGEGVPKGRRQTETKERNASSVFVPFVVF